jgi:hypothetical protein
MIQDEPIIFKVCNPDSVLCKFKIPYLKELLVENPRGKREVRMDIKVNTVWHKNVLPSDLEFDLMPGQFLTILVKPHNDEYFAGWGRWFHWNWDGNPQTEMTRFLSAVLSDPDFAHLENETKIGEYFRAFQYANTPITTAPNEDLDDYFEEIEIGFRASQYAGCEHLTAKPDEKTPLGLVKIGGFFRNSQYGGKFTPDFIPPDLIESATFHKILLKNNMEIFKEILDELKTEEMCEMALKADVVNFAGYVPDRLKTEKICKILVASDRFRGLQYVPESAMTQKICDIAVKNNATNLEHVPDKFKRKTERGRFYHRFVRTKPHKNLFHALLFMCSLYNSSLANRIPIVLS